MPNFTSNPLRYWKSVLEYSKSKPNLLDSCLAFAFFGIYTHFLFDKACFVFQTESIVQICRVGSRSEHLLQCSRLTMMPYHDTKWHFCDVQSLWCDVFHCRVAPNATWKGVCFWSSKRRLFERTIIRSDLRRDRVAPFEQEFQPLPLPQHLLNQPTIYTTSHNTWPFPAPPLLLIPELPHFIQLTYIRF